MFTAHKNDIQARIADETVDMENNDECEDSSGIKLLFSCSMYDVNVYNGRRTFIPTFRANHGSVPTTLRDTESQSRVNLGTVSNPQII